MAAWSDHRDWGDESDFRPTPYDWSADEVSTPVEPFPDDVWTFFSDSDLDQLVVDACKEMGRRNLERLSNA